MDWEAGAAEFHKIMGELEAYYGLETADFFKAVFDRRASQEARQLHVPTLLLMLHFARGGSVENL